MTSLKVAVKFALIAATLDPSTGTVEVTVGVEVFGVPPLPPPPPHPLINAIIKNAADHSSGFVVFIILLIFYSPNIGVAVTSTTFFAIASTSNRFTSVNKRAIGGVRKCP
jgi:hypothetical protein